MILKYANVDLSGFTTKYGFTETIRYVEGPNSGVTISGKEKTDIVAVKFDPSFVLRPLTQAQITILWTLVRALPSSVYRELKYTNAEGITRTIQAKLGSAEAVKCLETSSRTLFNGIVLTFIEE